MESKERPSQAAGTPNHQMPGRPEPAPRPDTGRCGDEWGEESRIVRARELGLPEDTPWGRIVAIWDERERAALAKELGLPEDTERHELDRIAEVRKLGLPEDASWIEIYRAWDENARVALAKGLGIQKEWTEYVSWVNILTTALDIDVSGSSSMEEIIGEIREKGIGWADG